MPARYLAFDIETAKLLDDFSAWRGHRPLGMICAATLKSDELLPQTWFGQDDQRQPTLTMTPEQLSPLVDYLLAAIADGYQIITWNGLSFDFDVLGEESQRHQDCVRIAESHIDMMFHAFCVLGYPIGLDAVAKGLGIPGKTEGMSADKAPELWQAGGHEKVLEYVSQDVRLTLDVAKAGDSQKGIRWRSRAGKPMRLDLPSGWYDVAAANKLPVPDTSWMTKPMQREDFSRWLSDSSS